MTVQVVPSDVAEAHLPRLLGPRYKLANRIRTYSIISPRSGAVPLDLPFFLSFFFSIRPPSTQSPLFTTVKSHKPRNSHREPGRASEAGYRHNKRASRGSRCQQASKNNGNRIAGV